MAYEGETYTFVITGTVNSYAATTSSGTLSNYATVNLNSTYTLTSNTVTTTISKGYVYVHYVDYNTGDYLEAKSTAAYDYVGLTYSTTQKTFSGYTFVEDSGNTSGTITSDTINVYYYYTAEPDGVSAPVKTVSSDTTSIGDTLTYTITWNVTDASSYSNTYYYTSLVFTDELPIGFSYSSIKVYNSSGTNVTSKAGTASTSGSYTTGITLTYTFDTDYLEDTFTYDGGAYTFVITGTVKYATNLTSPLENIVNISLTDYLGESYDLDSNEVKTTIPKGNYIIYYQDYYTKENIATSVTGTSTWVGIEYETSGKTISGYTYYTNSGNTSGTIVEGTTYIYYYYVADPDEPDDPVKTVDKTESYVGDTITYTITWDVTDASDYNDTITGYYYDSLVFTDTLQAGLKYSSLVVYNSSGTNITSTAGTTSTSGTYTSGVTVTYTFNSTYLQNTMAYEGETYTFVITATLYSSTYLTSPIENTANISLTDSLSNSYDLDSNEVETTLPSGKTITYYKDYYTKSNIVSSVTSSSKLVGASYSTTKKDLSSYGYTYYTNSGNTSGTIVEGTTYIYYYYVADPDEPDDPVKTVDKTEANVGDTITYTITWDVTDATDYNDTITGYYYDSLIFTDTLQTGLEYQSMIVKDSNSTDVTETAGSISTDGQLVTYTFDTDYLTNTIIYEGETYTFVITCKITDDIDSSTITNSANISLEDTLEYTYSLDTNEVTTTIPTGTVITYYLDKDTLEEIADSITTEDYSGKDYTTSPKDISGYAVSSNSGNTTGAYTDGIIYVYYYYVKAPDTPDDPVKTVDKTESYVGDTITYTITWDVTDASEYKEASEYYYTSLVFTDELPKYFVIDTSSQYLTVYDSSGTDVTSTARYC